jgi:predicted nucleic acid-binding protein
MEIVLDTSVIIAVIANEPEKAAIVRQTRGVALIAPRSVHWEIGNAFSAMLKRGRITLDQARQAVKIYHTIPIQFVEVELESALQISDDLKIYAYDSYIIQCAIHYKRPLMTLDRDLLGYAQQKGVRTIEVFL